MKHPTNYIVSVMSTLPWFQKFSYIWPLRITGKCNKKIWSTIFLYICHGILSTLMHISWTTCKRRGQNNNLTNILRVRVSFNGIFQVDIVFSSQFLLIVSDECETLRFYFGVHIYDILIEKLSK
uniref:Uncharacterized protein n=1 Tax=Cacopsylla melanoneura TaxID=428564 RepID=A0A8D8R9V9_9HEMI